MKFLFTTALLLAIGCLDQADDPKTGSGPSADDTSSTLDDTGAPAGVEVQLEVTLDSDCVVCARVHVSASESVPVTLMVGESGGSLSPWAWSDAADEHLVPLIELKPETTYDVAIRVESDPTTLSESHTFTTGALPEQLPKISLTPDHSGQIQTGLTILSLTELKPYAEMDANFIVAINPAGEVVWYHQLVGLNTGLYVDELMRIYTAESALAAVRVDPYGGTKTVWTTESLGIETTHHEVRPLADGGLATLATEMRTIPGWVEEHTDELLDFDIIGDVFATFDGEGHQTWSWSLLDHFDPRDQYTPDMHVAFWDMPPYDVLEAPKDWSHGNAMVPNGASWLGSFRNLDWLIQVNADTDEIDWIFGPGGDFELTEGSRWFSRQHSPAVQTDGSILLYDNGNARADREEGEQPYSRVVEYELDEESGTATELWSWDGGTTRTFCPIVGDVDQLDGGSHLITDGAIFETITGVDDEVTSHFYGRVREVASIQTEPEVVWEVQVGASVDDPGGTDSPSWIVYRAIRIDSLYPEYARPR